MKSLNKDISCYDSSFITQTIEKRFAASSLPSLDAYIEWVAKEYQEAEELFQCLNISYSEFFRNPNTFAVLEEHILPKIQSTKLKNEEVRVWSAGCAAGQEPYSIAILMEDLNLNRSDNNCLRFRIFATDKSESELINARKGIYDLSDIQNVRLRQIRSYFSENGSKYALNDTIKKRVDFSVHDLMNLRTASPATSIFGDFDLVFCCNLLFYYQPDAQNFILNRISSTLAPNGFLVTGDTEKNLVEKNRNYFALSQFPTIFVKS